jgi:hypothetical protein
MTRARFCSFDGSELPTLTTKPSGIFNPWHFLRQWMTDSRFDAAHGLLEEISAQDPSVSRAIMTELVNLVRTIQFETSAASSVLLQEREMISERVRDFSSTDSRPWKFFLEHGWDKLSVKEYVGIGQVLAAEARLEMDREAKRRKEVLFKWMDDHWDELTPFLNRLNLEFEEHKP